MNPLRSSRGASVRPSNAAQPKPAEMNKKLEQFKNIDLSLFSGLGGAAEHRNKPAEAAQQQAGGDTTQQMGIQQVIEFVTQMLQLVAGLFGGQSQPGDASGEGGSSAHGEHAPPAAGGPEGGHAPAAASEAAAVGSDTESAPMSDKDAGQILRDNFSRLDTADDPSGADGLAGRATLEQIVKEEGADSPLGQAAQRFLDKPSLFNQATDGGGVMTTSGLDDMLANTPD